MNTRFALLARFETPVVALDDICQEFFNVSPKTASQKAKAQDLPIPVFKMRESERMSYMVKIEDLAAHIDAMHEQAKNEWQSVQS